MIYWCKTIAFCAILLCASCKMSEPPSASVWLGAKTVYVSQNDQFSTSNSRLPGLKDRRVLMRMLSRARSKAVLDSKVEDINLSNPVYFFALDRHSRLIAKARSNGGGHLIFEEVNSSKVCFQRRPALLVTNDMSAVDFAYARYPVYFCSIDKSNGDNVENKSNK